MRAILQDCPHKNNRRRMYRETKHPDESRVVFLTIDHFMSPLRFLESAMLNWSSVTGGQTMSSHGLLKHRVCAN